MNRQGVARREIRWYAVTGLRGRTVSNLKRKRTADVRVPQAQRPPRPAANDRLKALAKTCRKARALVFEADRRACKPEDQGPLELATLGKIRKASSLLEQAAAELDDLAVRPKV